MAAGQDDTSIFTKEGALTPDFLPSNLPGREAHTRELAFLIEPAIRGVKPSNAFLYGPPGTGKTVTAKYVLNQLIEASSKAVSVYVNGWQESTRLAVLSRLAIALRLPLPRRGLAEDEVLTRIMEVLRKEQRVMVVVLDEADRLNGVDRLLYDLSRASEVHQAPMGVITISNEPDLLANLDDRVRSSLSARSIEFKAYSPIELKAILTERAKLAFRPGVVNAEGIAMAAALAASKNRGDARIALETLLRAGRFAESKGRGQVGAAEVKESNTPFSAEPLEEIPETMGKGEELLLEVVKSMPGAKKGGVEANVVYEEYAKRKQETERSIRNHLAMLERRGIVESWNERNTRYLKLKRTG